MPIPRDRPLTRPVDRPVDRPARPIAGPPAQPVLRAVDPRAAAEDAAFTALPKPPRRAGVGAGARAAHAGLKGLVAKKARRAVMVALLGVGLLGGGLAGTGVIGGAPPPAKTSALQLRMMQMHADTARDVKAFDVAPLAQLAGMTKDELARSVTHAGLTATVAGAQRIDVDGGALLIPAGARISARIDAGGVYVSSVPALSFERDRALDVQVESVRYSFDEGKLHVSASGLGPDALYTKAATARANDALLPLLPAELKAPGFDPYDVGHLELLHRTLAAFTGSGAGGARAAGDGLGADLEDAVASWSASVGLRPVKQIRGALQDGVSLTIQEGAPLDLRVEAKMQGGRPVVQSVELFARDRGPIVQRGDSKLASLEVQRLTLTRDPAATTPETAFRVSADYSLEAESTVRGVIALFGAIAGAARGTTPEMGAAVALHRAGDVKLGGVRTQVDDAFQQLSAPLAKLLADLHVAAPGVGLDRLM